MNVDEFRTTGFSIASKGSLKPVSDVSLIVRARFENGNDTIMPVFAMEEGIYPRNATVERINHFTCDRSHGLRKKSALAVSLTWSKWEILKVRAERG